MGILRKIKKTNFTTVNNEYLQDEKLSWKAKGLITFLMSLPDDWKVNIAHLTKCSKDGRDGTMSTLKEIELSGYGKKIVNRSEDGKFDNFDFEVSDFKSFKPITEKPITEKPITEKPITENPTLLNTNREIKTNITKIEAPVKTGSLFPNDPQADTKDRKTLFANSIYGTFEKFEEKFRAPEFADVDLFYYFNAVSDWSDSADRKRTARGWIATAKTFMRGDLEKKRLKLKAGTDPNQDTTAALNYLKGFN